MDYAERIVSRYQDQGYKLVEELYSWRFYVVTLEKDGQKFLLKVGQKSSKFFEARPLDKMWGREQKFVDFVNRHIEESADKPPFRLVKFYERDQDEELAWTLQEYISGEHVFDHDKDGLVEPIRWLPIMVRIHQWFDVQETSDWGPLDRDLKAEFLEKIKKWSEEPLQRQILKTEELSQVLNIINQYAPSAEIRIQHGDFVPWHLHNIGFPNTVLVDLEAANLRYRHYDLAYAYHRIFTKRAEPNLARTFINEFLKSVDDKSKFMMNIMPSFANRAIGGLQDYCNEYESRSPESNAAHLNLQRGFLEVVLKNDLDVFR